MAKGNKRARADADEAGPSEDVKITAKRPRGVQRQQQPAIQDNVAEVDVPVRDRREVMADVARR